MRIGLSAYLLHSGSSYRAAGVSTYVAELLAHLPSAAPDLSLTAFVAPAAPPTPGIRQIVSPVPTQRALVRIPWEQVALPVEAAVRALDVLHGTVNVVPFVTAAPSVVTVHDLSFLRLPERFPRAKVLYLTLAVRASVGRARRVIAVSENTRRDLIELLDVPEEKVDVVYSGVNTRFQPLDPDCVRTLHQAYGNRPFILYVGTLEPRKNLDVLIRAYARAREDGIPHRLVLAGGGGWMYDSLFTLVRALGVEEDVHFAGYVAPADLPRWYNAADLFAYPSAYEGFGLPVLEAMACGTPIITTGGGALQEVAGKVGVTVEPGSVLSLQSAMTQVLEDATLRNKMRQAGLERARLFRWDRTAARTAEIYREVAA